MKIEAEKKDFEKDDLILKEKLEKWEGNYMNVIKEYLNPNFNKKIVKKDNRSTNEKMMGEIRGFMDTASADFLDRKEKEERFWTFV